MHLQHSCCVRKAVVQRKLDVMHDVTTHALHQEGRMLRANLTSCDSTPRPSESK